MKFKFIAMAAAVAATTSAAGAADLNRPAKVAVDYVKVCNAYGAGFFYIPGSDTCLKIGGRVYFDERVGGGKFSREANQNTPFGDRTRTGNTYFSRAAAYVNFDARTNTEFGLLRSYEEARLRYSTQGAPYGTTELDLTNAYVQWGGLFAGKMRSAFDFTPTIASLDFDMVVFQTNTLVNQIGYTFSFGNGVTATIAALDATTGDATYNNSLRNETDGAGYGGNKVPDVVAALNVTQAWGSAQIAAAYHDDYSATGSVGDKAGWAINGGIAVNLPTLGAGDTIAAGIGYSQGALGYVTPFASGAGTIGTAFRPGAGSYIGNDWAVGADGRMHQSQTWGAIVSFHHVFNPNFQFDIDGSYHNQNGYQARDFNIWTLSSDVKWLPTADPKFYIALEGEYGTLNYSGATKAAFAATSFGAGELGLSNVSGWTAGIRINRNF